MVNDLKWKHDNCKGYSYDRYKKVWCAEVMIMGKKYRKFAQTPEAAAKLRARLVLFRDGIIQLEEI